MAKLNFFFMCLGEQGDGEGLPNILQHSTLQREKKKKKELVAECLIFSFAV